VLWYVRPVSPEEALADLTEVSSQLESVVLARPDRSVVASTLADDDGARTVAENAVGLLERARDVADAGRDLTQVHVATREGCVFVVRDDRHVLAGVTGPDPTVGLVFYDLKTALRVLEEAPEEKPKRRRKATDKEADA
jgi:predicted regulator of Ras-like GTPase activity (Roadblock/LC7/MglB family)